jgi:hypothetical protein
MDSQSMGGHDGQSVANLLRCVALPAATVDSNSDADDCGSAGLFGSPITSDCDEAGGL